MGKSWGDFWENYKKENPEPYYSPNFVPLFRLMLMDKQKEAVTPEDYEKLQELEAKIDEYEAQEKELEEARAEWYKNAVEAFEQYCKGVENDE